MEKKKTGLMITALTMVIIASFYFYHSKELYGNDKESIVKVIQSVEGYENKEIEILDINDFEDIRIAGFMSNNSPSYIEFYKNKQGNYVWRHIETQDEESFSMFSPLMGNPKMMYVTNYENEIVRMKVDINGTTLEQNFTPYQATVTWVDLPQTNQDSYEFRNYRFYDKNGNLIKEM